MDLDDELRQLFTSDRLDVPVRADAEEIIVAGARRVRRRRIAAATASGVVAVVAVVAVGVALAGGDPDAMPPATTNPTTPTEQSSVPAGPPSLPADTGTPTLNTATSTSTTTAKPTTSRTKTTDPGPPTLNFMVVGPTGLGSLELGQSLEDAQATGLLGARTSEVNGCGAYELLADDRVGGGLVYVTDTVQVIAAYPVETPEGVGRGWTIAQVKDVYPDLDERAAEAGTAVVPVVGNASASFRLHFTDGVVNSVTLELDGQSCI